MPAIGETGAGVDPIGTCVGSSTGVVGQVKVLLVQLEPVLQLQKVLFHLEPVTLEPVTLIQQEWTWVQLVLPRLNCWIHWCCRCLFPREGLLEA